MAKRSSKGRKTPREAQAGNPPPAFVEEAGTPQPAAPFPVVGIGASAGGLDPLAQLLRALPVDTGMAFVLIQHLDPSHASMLAEILSRATVMPVTEVSDQMPVRPNHVYVIPPGVTMGIERGTLRLTPRREVQGQHRPIDHFLRALAQDRGHRAIGVILSGSATDGTLGLEAIKAESGITFAQDKTAQHASMPRSAEAAGCVDFVLPPAEIAQEIVRISRHPYVAWDAETVEAQASEPSLGRVLEQLRMATGVDFSKYKRNTLYRRIIRRAVLHKMEGLRDYARFLQSNPTETDALYQDVLISVTRFFRNPEAFEVLKAKVFPRLVKDRSRHDPIRVWSIGCSTGEEPYSIAIAFAEFSEGMRPQIPVQIFATDLSGAGIERARVGLYSKTITQDVSPDRLRRFFFETGDSYRISKSIRDTTVFARHNVLTEPPFSRIDLISCRNLLIYLEPSLQERAIGVMQYALKPHGALWLGNSETIGAFRDLFDVEDGPYKMYLKKPGPSRVAPRPFSGHPVAARRMAETYPRELAIAGPDVLREADRLLLAKYTPASVLVNADMEILQFRGDTGLYLTPAPGKASLNLLKMLRDGLLVGVRAALHRAKREEAPAREEGLSVQSNGAFRLVNVHAIPLTGNAGSGALHFLVLFEDASRPEEIPVKATKSGRRKGRGARLAEEKAREARESETARLAQELAATREYLQSVIEQQEAAAEELQSSNEEVQSANEELQSINEELETSKEEVQSSNEELTTVNEELQNRNVELVQSNNDFINLLASVYLPIVMLGRDLRIRRFTPMAEKMFNLIATDVGRPISDIQLGIGVPDLERMLIEVMETVAVKETEVQDKQGHWHVLRLRPYRTQDNRIDGALLMLIDVDVIKRDQETLRRQAGLLGLTHEAIIMWELDAGNITYWNRGAEETYGYTKEQALGKKPYELLATSPGPDMFRAALREERQWTGELVQVRRDGEPVIVDSRMVVERDVEGPPLVFETNHPITERKRLENTLREQASELIAVNRAKDEFLAMLAHELRNPLAPLAHALEIVRDPGAAPAMKDRAREIMGHQIQNLARLIDDLLDVSRISHGRIQIRKEPTDASAAVRRAVDATRQTVAAREQDLMLSLPEDPVDVEADPLRLEQIVGNLLSNASKFTGRGGHIWLSAERESGELVTRVRDDGIGMAPETLPRLFEMFMQVDSAFDRPTAGLGIGLSLVRHLAELHGGRVEAYSEGLGRGSEFVVRLPLPSRELDDRHPTPAPEAPESEVVARRVLVADDNLDGAEALAIVLSLAGHDVRIAHGGRDAVEIAAAFRPEVVLLDIGMPGMDGHETARQLRGITALERTLLVAVTGFGQEADRRRAQSAGFDEFVVKPVLPNIMRVLVQKAPRSAPPQAADS
jgi:two-component system, chemotaxis family, CheB/CheR fusion protein